MDQSTQNDGSTGDRAYFRVHVDIPLRATLVAEDEVEAYASEILSQLEPGFPELDPTLIAWLDRIERKLDRLLTHLDLSDVACLGPQDRKHVDLSAAGMQFHSSRVDPGASVLLEFELPEVPVRFVRCLGRVTWTDAESGDSESTPIGLVFETIRQSDRDAIVRYTLAVQRQAIRGKRQHGNTTA